MNGGFSSWKWNVGKVICPFEIDIISNNNLESPEISVRAKSCSIKNYPYGFLVAKPIFSHYTCKMGMVMVYLFINITMNLLCYSG